jgi:hypothetical protein
MFPNLDNEAKRLILRMANLSGKESFNVGDYNGSLLGLS